MIFIIAAINALSAFIQAASGFGYSIFAMFLMPMLLPYWQCSVISAAVIVVIAVQMVISLHSHIKIKKVILPMIFCLFTTWIGVNIMQSANEGVMRKVMGIFLILLTIYFYLTKKYNISLRNNIPNSAGVGLLTGITTGMFNIVGPFLALYYYDNCEDNLEFKGNLECSFLFAGLFSLLLNLSYAEVDRTLAFYTAASCVGAVLAGFAGLRIFRRLNKDSLKYIIMCVLPIMGMIQIFK